MDMPMKKRRTATAQGAVRGPLPEVPATMLISPRWLEAIAVAGDERVHGLATLRRDWWPSAVTLGDDRSRCAWAAPPTW